MRVTQVGLALKLPDTWPILSIRCGTWTSIFRSFPGNKRPIVVSTIHVVLPSLHYQCLRCCLASTTSVWGVPEVLPSLHCRCLRCCLTTVLPVSSASEMYVLVDSGNFWNVLVLPAGFSGYIALPAWETQVRSFVPAKPPNTSLFGGGVVFAASKYYIYGPASETAFCVC